MIPVKDLAGFFDIVKTEQSFRQSLHNFRETQELQLKRMRELKGLAKRLEALKQKYRDSSILKDKELDKEVRKVLNRKFLGGVEL